jgi:hypothetical protein
MLPGGIPYTVKQVREGKLPLRLPCEILVLCGRQPLNTIENSKNSKNKKLKQKRDMKSEIKK